MTLLWLTLLGVTTGCIREDRGDCRFPLRLSFTYLYNLEDADLLGAEVSTLKLYLYDTESGRLVASTSRDVAQLDAAHSMTWEVPAGRYTLVTWGGVESRYEIKPGESIGEMSLMLPPDASGTVPHRQEHLWHSLDTDILVNGDVTPVYDVDLHKLSNDVTVTVAAAEGSLLPQHPSSAITSTNGLYNAFGAVAEAAEPITYTPAVEALSKAGDEETPAGSVHSYTTLTLADGDDTTLSVDLGGTTVYNGSLTDLIARDPHVDFDLYDEFKVAFVVVPHDNTLEVAVSVNGWQVVEYDVTLK